MKVKKAWFVPQRGGGQPYRLMEIEGEELSLAALYPFIGNECRTVERVALKKGVDMWVDEEGLLKENAYNPIGSFLYQKAYKDAVFPNPEELGVVGNAIIIDNTKEGHFMEGQ